MENFYSKSTNTLGLIRTPIANEYNIETKTDIKHQKKYFYSFFPSLFHANFPVFHTPVQNWNMSSLKQQFERGVDNVRFQKFNQKPLVLL